MSNRLTSFVDQINDHFASTPDLGARLSFIAQLEGKAAFSTSLSAEDQLVTHGIATNQLGIEQFTLDTGRMFEQTYKLLQETQDKYDINIKTYHPDAKALQAYVAREGMNGFYNSIEARKACCHVRKVQPLGLALEGVDLWISGLRHVHSDNRHDLPFAEIDESRGLVKVYPVVDLEDEDLWAAIKTHKIPYNELHDVGFPSIGCAPCTRAVKEGEPARAGRWWWEASSQECGLHMDKDGKLVRANA